MFAWSSNELWGGWPYSLEIAVVDAVAARVSLKIACARGPHFTGRCVSPAKALVANTIAAERGTPYDNHGGAARRRRSPVRVPESGWARPGRLSGRSTRWRARSETPAELADPGHGSSRRPTRPGASSRTITMHSPKGQGTCAGSALDRVPGEPAYGLHWSSRPVVTAEIPLCAPHSELDQVGLTG
jgi:hypothetical protein